MSKTRRSNEAYKRHHWHSARTERRNRFTTALKAWKRIRAFDDEVFLEANDKDMALRRGDNVKRGVDHGRGGVSFEGTKNPHIDWLTVDKSRIRYEIERGHIPANRAIELQRRLNL